MKGMPPKQQQHNFIVRKTISNYTEWWIAKASLGGTEEQLTEG